MDQQQVDPQYFDQVPGLPTWAKVLLVVLVIVVFVVVILAALGVFRKKDVLPTPSATTPATTSAATSATTPATTSATTPATTPATTSATTPATTSAATSAVVLSVPTTSAPTTRVPCAYSDWSKCDCLSKTQTRMVTSGDRTYCQEPLTRVCNPDPSECANWFGFTNAYISDGEYFSRSCEPSLKTCYEKCEANPSCAAVYAWDGPSGQSSQGCGNDRQNVECSQVTADKVPLFYGRYGSMSSFQPDNRHVFVNRQKAGNFFQPQTYQTPVI